MKIKKDFYSGLQGAEEEDVADEIVPKVPPSVSGPIPSSSSQLSEVSAAAAKLGMTKDELVVHYSTCIRLGAQSKINVRNAFDLKLIDVMGAMIRKEEENGGGANEFNHASRALDASAKIYAVRVDAVHAEMLNMAGSLNEFGAGKKNQSE